MKEVFFTPRTPSEPIKGIGWIEINDEAVKRLHIHHLYKCVFYGGISEIIGPDGVKFDAYLDNPNGFGGRHKKRFTVHTHGGIEPWGGSSPSCAKEINYRCSATFRSGLGRA